jgi:hypothetical protein
MRRAVLAAIAVLFVGLFWSQSAEARCWWNGYRWRCTHHHYRHWYRPYYYPSYYYHPYYYRPYVCTPWPLCWG